MTPETPSAVETSAQGGSREAWARAWLPRVYGVALALTRRVAEAEDLAQEALLRALRTPDAPRDTSAFGPWVVRVMRNAWIDRCRRERRRSELSDAEAVAASTGDAGAAVALWAALPEDERIVCWLKIHVGSTLREIAELLDTSKSAVDRTFHRGLERLRKELRS